ncbi:MAG: DCC1-like thiol-disulfide oxidoreductase family protein [Phycisphaeraceae bacterium]
MSNGWTGGQYSVFRVLLGVYAAAMLLSVVWRSEQLAVQGIAVVGAMLCVPMMLGWRDRWAAMGLLLACVVSVSSDVEGPAGGIPPLLVVVHFLLLRQAGVAPYGSLDAVGRVDPDGGWRFPPRLFAVVWLLLGGFYLYMGVVLLRDESWRLAEALFYAGGQWAVLPWGGTMPAWLGRGLTWLLLGTWLAFAPLALARRTRQLAWTLTLGVNLLVLPLAGQGALAAGLAVAHLLAFDPAWLPARRMRERRQPAQSETLFFDGHCGLCHRWVRFVLAEDRAGDLFVLAPLDSDHFRQSVPASVRDRLPDSVVVRRADGELLTRSAAVLHILDRLGGLWRVAGWIGQGVPAGVRDAAYDGVAAVRRRLFASPADACPMMPPGLRGRFRM